MRAVSVDVIVSPISGDSAAERAVIIDGIILHGDPVVKINSDLSSGDVHFPHRISVLTLEPLELLDRCFLRCGRWNIGRSDDFLVFWNDHEEGTDDWELGE